MNENNFGGLDDIDYSAKPSENNGPTGVSAPVLDDIDYVPPSAKRAARQEFPLLCLTIWMHTFRP